MMHTSLLGLSLALLTVTACSTEGRHRTIIFDQTWSSDAAVRNLSCVPDQSESCAREARDSELAFARKRSTAFLATPECATVRLIVPASSQDKARGDGNNAAKDDAYWTLRVDFRPRVTSQPFTLGHDDDHTRIGGDDAEHSSAFICKAVKNNGVTAIW
jgi:hypothetical protein